MKIHYTLDDSAARLPLAIRSADGLWDRAADLRTAPGVHLVELTTQHMLNTGLSLVDEIENYFAKGGPSESDPYALATCYENRQALEDLLRDLREVQGNLVALGEVEALFPASVERDLHFTLALTVVGYPAFGYVRTYNDSEGEEYHGMVVNLAQARPHLEQHLDRFSLGALVDAIRYSFFNHEGFLLAYQAYTETIRRRPEWLADQIKDMLLSRGIAWYLGTAYIDGPAGARSGAALTPDEVTSLITEWGTLLGTTRKRKATEEAVTDWLHGPDVPLTREAHIDRLGCHMAHTIAQMRGIAGLREVIERGPDRFITMYNILSGRSMQV